MSVYTDADAQIDAVASELRHALKRLNDVDEMWGYGDYSREYIEKVRKAKWDIEGAIISLDRMGG